MTKYIFTRQITKREAINQFGKLGFRTHEEMVVIPANSLEEAKELVAPFNYKKHIKFRYDDSKNVRDTVECFSIIDNGVVDEI